MVESEKGHRVFRKKVGNLFFEQWENPGRDGNPYVNYTILTHPQTTPFFTLDPKSV